LPAVAADDAVGVCEDLEPVGRGDRDQRDARGIRILTASAVGAETATMVGADRSRFPNRLDRDAAGQQDRARSPFVSAGLADLARGKP